jgi:hypothetical protein
MSKRVETIDLAIPPDRALEACRRALVELGWSGDEAGERLRLSGREDATRLCCHQSPASVEIELRAHDGGTAVHMAGQVPGFGPVSKAHLSSRMEALWRHLLRAAD